MRVAGAVGYARLGLGHAGRQRHARATWKSNRTIRPSKARVVTLPGAIDGRFEVARRPGLLSVRGQQGPAIRVRRADAQPGLALRSVTCGSTTPRGACWPRPRMPARAEGSLNYTFPADGVYRLRVEETNRRGGFDMVYRIVVTPYQPGFDLAAEAEKVNAPQNGVFVVKVTADPPRLQRADHAGGRRRRRSASWRATSFPKASPRRRCTSRSARRWRRVTSAR